MQTLYTVATLETEAKAGEPKKTLQNHFDQSLSLFYIPHMATHRSGTLC